MNKICKYHILFELTLVFKLIGEIKMYLCTNHYCLGLTQKLCSTLTPWRTTLALSATRFANGTLREREGVQRLWRTWRLIKSKFLAIFA
jgi:hypothetical protein